MGRLDSLTKDYMSNPEHFADAFNYYIFQGQQVIDPKSLTELDTTQIGIIMDDIARASEKHIDNEVTSKVANSKISGNLAKDEVIQKARDLLKSCVFKEDDEVTYVLLGLENQSNIHYAMPVRVMLYDALQYYNQVRQISNEHSKLKDLRGDEFLSGFSRSDTIKPVITLTIYFGTDDWDGPRSLMDMFNVSQPKLLSYINNYPLHLILPKEIDDFTLFKSELRNVLQYIAVTDDKDKFNSIANDKSFDQLQQDTVRLINECTNSNIRIPNKEGTNMSVCKGIEEWKADIREEAAREAARESGIQASIEAWQDADFSEDNILSRLQNKYQLDEATAKEYFDKYSLQIV